MIVDREILFFHTIEVVDVDGSAFFLCEEFFFDRLFADIFSWEDDKAIPVTYGSETKRVIFFWDHYPHHTSRVFTYDEKGPMPAIDAYQFEEGDILRIPGEKAVSLKPVIQRSYLRSCVTEKMCPHHTVEDFRRFFAEAAREVNQNPDGPLKFPRAVEAPVLR